MSFILFSIFHGEVITANLGTYQPGYEDFTNSSKPIKPLEIFSINNNCFYSVENIALPVPPFPALGLGTHVHSLKLKRQTRVSMLIKSKVDPWNGSLLTAALLR